MRESNLSRNTTNTLTFLEGIYFIYGTSLLIMKRTITPARTHSSYEVCEAAVTL